MYVCICHGIRCRDVRSVARTGKCRATDVFDHFQTEPRCGKCLAAMSSLLEANAEANANEALAPAAAE